MSNVEWLAVTVLRYAKLTFPSETSATIHGFAGYFEAKLFGDINISIVPQVPSPLPSHSAST